MTLYESYSLLEFICNKDFEGNIITPDRFNMLIKVASIDLFRKKYGLPEGYQPGRPIPNEFADITLKNTDDLKAFKQFLKDTVVTDGILPYPSDYAHRDTLTYKYVKTINKTATTLPRPIEILREGAIAERRGNWTKQPTLKDPVAAVRSDGIYIYPEEITLVDFAYYRFPIDPVFAYTEFDGYIEYDATNSTEWEWGKGEHTTLTMMLLSYIGINLKESDLFQYSELRKKEGV